MGQDKAELIWRGQSFLNHTRALLDACGALPILISGVEGGLPDKIPGGGPVSGLCALRDIVAQGQGPLNWIILPVDMPLLQPQTVKRLMAKDAPATYFEDKPLPLCLRFDEIAPRVFDDIAERLKKGQSTSVYGFLKTVKGQAITPLPHEMPELVNINTRQEFEQLKETSHVER